MGIMRSRRLLVSAIGAVLSLSAAVALANAGPPQAPPERLKTTADSIQVRLMYGLRADRAFVESLGQVASPLLGIPLSKSEQAEMERRKRVQDSLDPLKAYAQSADALFAGMFIDQAAGGILDIALTAAAPQSVRNDLLSIAPREAAVRFRTVSFSMAELQSVRNELQKLAATEPQDVQSGIGAISTDVRSTVTARQGQDADSVGESVCLSGVTSGFSCGTITDVDVDNVFDGSITQNNLRTANYISTGGDSGSPIFYGNTAKGIHKGSLGSVKFYSHIWEVESALGVKVLVAPT